MQEAHEVQEAQPRRQKGDYKRMTDAAREARNAYKREWARSNPEKVKAAQDRYWTKKAEEKNRETEQKK